MFNLSSKKQEFPSVFFNSRTCLLSLESVVRVSIVFSTPLESFTEGLSNFLQILSYSDHYTPILAVSRTLSFSHAKKKLVGSRIRQLPNSGQLRFQFYLSRGRTKANLIVG